PKAGQISIFDLIARETTIWIKDAELILDSVEKKYESLLTTDESEKIDFIPKDVYIPKSIFETGLQKTNCIEFSSSSYFSAELVIPYAISPQPAFNKNFELLTQNLIDNQKKGFQNIILTKNAKQTERMYNLFEDTGKEVAF
ncbi:MAG: hypothetical protein IH948_03305, partial [Bacteroidetes bacterium]|nr:hypothetical protein [Bacteroidota bacterium]